MLLLNKIILVLKYILGKENEGERETFAAPGVPDFTTCLLLSGTKKILSMKAASCIVAANIAGKKYL